MQELSCLKMMIRKARISDMMNVYEWRNDQLSRCMFFNNSEVKLDEHKAWFKSYLKNPNKVIYIGILEKQKVGVTRFDFSKKDNITEVSINLNPIMRNKSLSLNLLSASVSLYLKNKNVDLRARVKNQNLPSLIIFKKAGFKKYGKSKNWQNLILRKQN